MSKITRTDADALIETQVANEIFDTMSAFAAYAFNKCATCSRLKRTGARN